MDKFLSIFQDKFIGLVINRQRKPVVITFISINKALIITEMAEILRQSTGNGIGQEENQSRGQERQIHHYDFFSQLVIK